MKRSILLLLWAFGMTLGLSVDAKPPLPDVQDKHVISIQADQPCVIVQDNSILIQSQDFLEVDYLEDSFIYTRSGKRIIVFQKRKSIETNEIAVKRRDWPYDHGILAHRC